MFTTYQVPPQRSERQEASTPMLNVWFAKFRHTAERVFHSVETRQAAISARLHG